VRGAERDKKESAPSAARAACQARFFPSSPDPADARPSHPFPLPPQQARQEFHLDVDPAFQPTGNARCEAMMTEATEFAAALKRCEKDIRGVKVAAEGECCRWFFVGGHEARTHS
jgi:hypothetical protein